LHTRGYQEHLLKLTSEQAEVWLDQIEETGVHLKDSG